MSDSVGSLCDKLNTISLKMWWAQEDIYDIRHMTFEEYKAKYFEDPVGAQKLWEILKKACDLNLQRNTLIDEIDQKIVEMIETKMSGENLDNGKFIQKKHKTY
jgi:hypothetical protein